MHAQYRNEHGKLISVMGKNETDCIYCHRGTYGKNYVIVESECLHLRGRSHIGCASEAEERHER